MCGVSEDPLMYWEVGFVGNYGRIHVSKRGITQSHLFFSSYLWFHSVRIEFREDNSDGRVEKDNVQKKFLSWRP